MSILELLPLLKGWKYVEKSNEYTLAGSLNSKANNIIYEQLHPGYLVYCNILTLDPNAVIEIKTNNITYYKNSIYLANLINDEIIKIKAYNAAVPNNIFGNIAAQANVTNIENLNLGAVITQSNSYYSVSLPFVAFNTLSINLTLNPIVVGNSSFYPYLSNYVAVDIYDIQAFEDSYRNLHSSSTNPPTSPIQPQPISISPVSQGRNRIESITIKENNRGGI